MKNLSIFLLLSAMLFSNCSQKSVAIDDVEDIDDDNEFAEWPHDQLIYLVGFEMVEGYRVARLWKNGEVQNLSKILENEIPLGLKFSDARSVFVSGDDVYVAGCESLFNVEETISCARLWKNGVIENLPSTSYFAEAFSVFVEKDDVYVLGREITPNGRWAFVVWKNGHPEIFAEVSSICKANSIFVLGEDIYVAGAVMKYYENDLQAVLWKNGIVENLVSESHSSEAYSVYVSGDDVYVAGTDSEAILWKNGEKIILGHGIANSVSVSGDDIYVAGFDNLGGKLWKNGIVLKNETETDDSKIFYSVFVKDNDIFWAGFDDFCIDKEKHLKGEDHIHTAIATIRKNGEKLRLSLDSKLSIASSVFVK